MDKPEIMELIKKLINSHIGNSSKVQKKAAETFVDMLKTNPVTKFSTGHNSCSI